MKSPKFTARGTAVRVRFLQEALVILVLKQTLQFRSFGEVSKNAVLTRYHFLLAALKVIHEKNWKRLAVLEHIIYQTVPELL